MGSVQPVERLREANADRAAATRSALAVALAHLAVLLLRGAAIAILAAPVVIGLALLLR